MRATIFFSSVAILFFAAYGFAGEGAVNFSGEWSLNKDKSKLGESREGRGGGRGGRAPLKLTITQKGNDLTVKRLSQDRSGEEFTFEEKFTLDGKECENTFRERPRISVAKWSDDGKSLTITATMIFDRGGQEFEMVSIEVWSLIEVGKVLSIESSMNTPRGERKTTRVYDKVEGK